MHLSLHRTRHHRHEKAAIRNVGLPLLITEGYYYVDKTRYIELLENRPRCLFLLRPRRFGKPLFPATPETYYSVDYADRFGELFGGLHIGQHPTKEHNRYLVPRFNFSEVSANPDETEQSFKAYCSTVITRFAKKYGHLLGREVWSGPDISGGSPGLMLDALARYISDNGCHHICLLIDEYDNFTSTLPSSYGTGRYRRTTCGGGFIRGREPECSEVEP